MVYSSQKNEEGRILKSVTGWEPGSQNEEGTRGRPGRNKLIVYKRI